MRPPATIRLILIEETQTPILGRATPGSEDIEFGCEGGQVIVEDGEYHLFTTEVHGRPKLQATRLGHWRSGDGLHFTRHATIAVPMPDAPAPLDYNSPWTPYPIFNEREDHWNLFFVGYGKRGATIVRARSRAAGRSSGLLGPWENVDAPIVPDGKPLWWMSGHGGAVSFFPYEVDGRWLAFFGHNNIRPATTRDDWRFFVGLAQAPALAGPWTPIDHLNPVLLDERFVENPVVVRLRDRLWIALYDGETTAGIAYATSTDGVQWSSERVLWLTSPPAPWAWHMRTPLGMVALPGTDGLYTLYYTAFDQSEPHPMQDPIYHAGFGTVGRLVVRVVDS
jgi:hypothetical protein